ncbi:MAG: hypothetical protein AAF799_47745 [Myxococcota bacterium]
MNTIRLGARALVAGLVVMVGCPSDDTGEDGSMDDASMTSSADDTSDSGVSGSGYAQVIQPIWDEHCTEGCHEPGGAWALLDLSDPGAYDILTMQDATQVALPFVAAGDTNMSYLWHKLNGTQQTAGGGGTAMPQMRADGTLTTLTAAQLSAVESWINDGAEP